MSPEGFPGLGVDVLGCRASWSRLNEPLGIPVAAECTVTGRIVGYGDVYSLAVEASAHLSRLLGRPLAVDGLSGWEFIGGRFNLYTFTLAGGVGVLRVVESGGYPLGAYAALSGEAVPHAGPGWSVAEDGALGAVYLASPPEEPGDAGGGPPGQKYIPRMVVYAVEGVPRVDPAGWRLRVEGAVEEPAVYTLDSLYEGLRGVRGDFHCVTGWSVGGRLWEGVPLRELLSASRPLPGAAWLAAVSVGGYSTVVPLEEALEGMLVLRVDGEPLDSEHGFPARLYLPRLYGWKHAKWVTRLEVLEGYEDGYWEALAYHERGLVEVGERFKVRNPELADAGRLLGRPRKLKPPAGNMLGTDS